MQDVGGHSRFSATTMEKVRWPPTGLQSPRSRTWAYLLAGAGIFAVGLYYATSYIIDHKLYPWGPGGERLPR